MVVLRTLHLYHSFPKRTPSIVSPIFILSPSSSPYSSSVTVREIPRDEAIPTVQPPETTPNPNPTKKKKKTLGLFFKEAVGLIEKTSESEYEDESDTTEIGERAKKLRVLERELKNLIPIAENAKQQRELLLEKKHGDGTVGASLNRLYSLFAEPSNSDEKRAVFDPKELSPEMVSFVSRLYEGGYLNDGNFTKDGGLDLNCLSSSYSYDYLKFAAEMFGQDHQESSKQLSESDLKMVALFGCPSVEKRTVFAAKSLRSFFCVREDIVCRPCKLKSSCKFADQRVKKKWDLDLKAAMRVLAVYGLGSLPHQLTLSDDIKVSIGKLLKKAVKLGK